MCNFDKGRLFLVLGFLVLATLLLVACGPSAPAGAGPAGGSAVVSESELKRNRPGIGCGSKFFGQPTHARDYPGQAK